MLIESHRHTSADLEHWAQCERVDGVHAMSMRHTRRVAESVRAVHGFAREPCYAGVSWGKDSVVLAHLVAQHAPHVPLVWVRVEPICNPDCELVRDEFLRQHPAVRYEEIAVWCRRGRDGQWHATGTLERGFGAAVATHGPRRISGIRGAESGARDMRMRKHGVATDTTCAPIGWWDTADVFAYLHAHALPVHPAYACTQGGIWPRDRIRVASIGGQRGTGHGRAEWERLYYPAIQPVREKTTPR